MIRACPFLDTPAGVIDLLLREKNSYCRLFGGYVVGRSTLVGKPVYQMLLSLDATVTIAHSKTKKILRTSTCRSADILIAALGRPEFVNDRFVKPGAVVISMWEFLELPREFAAMLNFPPSLPLPPKLRPFPAA